MLRLGGRDRLDHQWFSVGILRDDITDEWCKVCVPVDRPSLDEHPGMLPVQHVAAELDAPHLQFTVGCVESMPATFEQIPREFAPPLIPAMERGADAFWAQRRAR